MIEIKEEMHLTKKNQRVHGRVYVLNANNANIVVKGVLQINSIQAYVLFDLGATHSFISKKFSCKDNFKIIQPDHDFDFLFQLTYHI